MYAMYIHIYIYICVRYNTCLLWNRYAIVSLLCSCVSCDKPVTCVYNTSFLFQTSPRRVCVSCEKNCKSCLWCVCSIVSTACSPHVCFVCVFRVYFPGGYYAGPSTFTWAQIIYLNKLRRNMCLDRPRFYAPYADKMNNVSITCL